MIQITLACGESQNKWRSEQWIRRLDLVLLLSPSFACWTWENTHRDHTSIKAGGQINDTCGVVLWCLRVIHTIWQNILADIRVLSQLSFALIEGSVVSQVSVMTPWVCFNDRQYILKHLCSFKCPNEYYSKRETTTILHKFLWYLTSWNSALEIICQMGRVDLQAA